MLKERGNTRKEKPRKKNNETREIEKHTACKGQHAAAGSWEEGTLGQRTPENPALEYAAVPEPAYPGKWEVLQDRSGKPEGIACPLDKPPLHDLGHRVG